MSGEVGMLYICTECGVYDLRSQVSVKDDLLYICTECGRSLSFKPGKSGKLYLGCTSNSLYFTVLFCIIYGAL